MVLDHPDAEAINKYNLFVPDIEPHDLSNRISNILGVSYLSDNFSYVWPVHGKVFGHRVLFTIPVSIAEKSVNVHFILDTGSPTTFIAEDVLQTLNSDWPSKYTNPKINGVEVEARASNKEKYFQGLNILGMNFLSRIDAELIVNMNDKTAAIQRL